MNLHGFYHWLRKFLLDKFLQMNRFSCLSRQIFPNQLRVRENRKNLFRKNLLEKSSHFPEGLSFDMVFNIKGVTSFIQEKF